jgi:hypothetical protein
VPVVELAVYGGKRGVACESFMNGVTIGTALVHGNEVLVGRDPDYDRHRRRENPGYTIAAVRDALEGVAAPVGWSGPAEMNGFDVWSGYVLFDAWIANRDRHHANC